MGRAAWFWLGRLTALQKVGDKNCLQLVACSCNCVQHSMTWPTDTSAPAEGGRTNFHSQQLGICVWQHGLACRRTRPYAGAQKHVPQEGCDRLFEARIACRAKSSVSRDNHVRGQGALAAVQRVSRWRRWQMKPQSAVGLRAALL